MFTLKINSNFMLISGVLCGSLTWRHHPAHPQISRSICHTPLCRLSPRASCSNQTFAACAFLPKHSVAFCLPVEATVHTPVSETHPYEDPDPASMPPDMGYGCKMVDGVMHVYTTRNIMEKWDVYTYETHNLFTWHNVGPSLFVFDFANRSTELDLPYPDLQEYIADMNVMMALIINGPV